MSDDGPFTVISPLRPLPRGARDALEEFGIIDESEPGEDGREAEVRVEERPTDDVLETWELFVEEDPIETWEDTAGSIVEIYPQVVYIDGETATLTPEEAAEQAREQGDFAPIDVPEDGPFGPVEMLTEEQAREIARSFFDEHTSVGRWSAVAPAEWDDEHGWLTNGEVIAQWQSPEQDGGRIYVSVEMDEGREDGDPLRFNTRAESTGDINFQNTNPTVGINDGSDGLTTALEKAVAWMRDRPAVTNYPTFSMQIENGILAPMLDVAGRVSGGNSILIAREDGIEIQAGGLHQTTIEIGPESMDEYDLTVSGRAVVNVNDLDDAASDLQYSDTFSMEADGQNKELSVTGDTIRLKHIASRAGGRRELGSGAAQAIIDGQRFERVILAGDKINGDTPAAVGIANGEAFLSVLAGDESQEAFQGDFRGRSVIGEAVTATQFSTLREIQKAFQRPSQNDVTLNVEDRGNLSLFYTQNGDATVNINVAANGLDRLDELKTTPPSVDDAPEPDAVDDGTVREPTEFTDTPGSWDLAVVARPDGDFRERYEARPLRDEDRRNPDIEIPETVLENAEEELTGIPAAMYEDGDVVALMRVDDVRGVEISATDMNVGPNLLRDRTTDADGNLTITAEDGWVGIHPDDVFQLREGEMQGGWTTAPVRRTDSRNNFHVWWGGRMERAYHYRETRSMPYFVYEWDTSDEEPEFQTGTLAESPARRNYLWVHRVPEDKEVIGLVPDTDVGQTPAELVFREDFEDDYEINPFLRSADDAAELVGETILARASGGFVREAEVVKEMRDAAGIRVSEEHIPDGFWAVSASAEHENSTFELIGVPREEPDDEVEEETEEPPEGFGRTIEDTFADEVIDAGEVEEVTEIVDPEAFIMDELDVTGDVAEGVVAELGADLPDDADAAIEELVRRVQSGEGLGVPMLDMMQVDELRDGIRRTQIDDPDTEPDPEPDPEPEFEVPRDFPSNSVVAQFDPDAVLESAWTHAERDFDRGQLLLLNDSRDVGVLAHRVAVGGTSFAVFIGVEYSEPVPDGELRDDTHVTVTERVDLGSVDDNRGDGVSRLMELTPREVRQQLVMREGPQALPQLEGGPPDLIPATEEVVNETREAVRDVLRDANDLMNTAIAAGAGDEQAVRSLAAGIGHLNRALEGVEDEPTQQDISDVEAAIDNVRDRTTPVEQLIEDTEPEPDTEPGDEERAVPDDTPERVGELSKAEIETIVEGATEGIEATAVEIEGDLQRIRMVPDGTIPIDTTNQITARFEDSIEATILSAIDRWETFADIDAVDANQINRSRVAINEQFGLTIPQLGTEEPEPDTETEPEVDDDKPEVVVELEQNFRSALMGMGLPDLENPPVEFRADEESGILVARPAESPEWSEVLTERPPFIQGDVDEPDRLLIEYIEALVESLTEPAADRVDIEAARRSIQRDVDDTDEDPTEDTGVRQEPIRVVDGEYTLPEGTIPEIASEAATQAEEVLGPAIQFEDTTRVGEAIIQDDQVAVRVEDGQDILDARREQEDIEERAPDIDLDQQATAESIEEAFPRLYPSQGSAIAQNFGTLRDLVESPLSELAAVRGVGDSTIEAVINSATPEMDRPLIEQRDRPLGIEDKIPEDSPMPEVRPDEEPDEPDAPDAVGVQPPEVAVTIPPTAPRGEKWLAQQIQRGDRVAPNQFDQNAIVEIVFPSRLSDRVRNVVAQNEIALGRQNRPMVQQPSFRDQLPEEAASLSGMQFLLSDPSDPRSSGYDINSILATLSDRLVMATVSPIVRAPIRFP